MRRSREMIAIVVLASALAADGTLRAAPVNQTADASTIAARFVQRISAGLRRTISSTPFGNHCSRGISNDSVEPIFQSQVLFPRMSRPLPSHLPLPPPII